MKLLHDQLSFQKTSRTGEVIPGTSIKAGYGDNSAVSSFSMEGDSTGALESCIRAIAAILQGRVSRNNGKIQGQFLCCQKYRWRNGISLRKKFRLK